MNGLILSARSCRIRLDMAHVDWKGLISLPEALILSDDKDSRQLYQEAKEEALHIEERLIVGAEPFINKEKMPEFLRTVADNSYFLRLFDNWDITQLVRKYNISGEQLFVALASMSVPTGIGCIEFKDLNDQEYSKIYQQHVSELNGDSGVYFDYVNGVRMKNWFPLDTNKSRTVIDLYKYDGGDAVVRISRLLASKYLD